MCFACLCRVCSTIAATKVAEQSLGSLAAGSEAAQVEGVHFPRGVRVCHTPIPVCVCVCCHTPVCACVRIEGNALEWAALCCIVLCCVVFVATLFAGRLLPSGSACISVSSISQHGCPMSHVPKLSGCARRVLHGGHSWRYFFIRPLVFPTIFMGRGTTVAGLSVFPHLVHSTSRDMVS